MSAIILDGKAYAAEIEAEVRNSLSELTYPYKLAILTDHFDPACEVYMRNKVKAAERCGIVANVIDIPDNISDEAIYKLMDDIDFEYDGAILQLPVKYPHIAERIIGALNPFIDVDGLTIENVGKMYSAKSPHHVPCTPEGIIALLKHYDIPMKGKHAVVIGRSYLVGRPLAELFLQHDATVTIAHSKTENLAEITKQADILVSAVGKAGLVTADMIKPGAAVVDVGINRVDGKLVGDVDFENVKEVAGWITPVPGGVGPMTVAMLMEHVVKYI